ncbi:hypothetical protein K461DRAFT_230541 [Myriangium duriaei CBS 260.36]|uniref:C2H2-type domain-containing protein n=1 Tax=Myriangium duriaei CBS 260.36 TaxID=1168546 RepID=A0A9P4IXY4_9PEZI|nr:hypothetical protein K461DRAFT_230541 [Myriangium duriaei CBS 260.36]
MLDAASSPNDAESTSDKRPKEKRFQCSTCQRAFARLEHLQRHERTHTNEKPFFCKLCDHKFSRSDLLTRHERLAHKIQKSNTNPLDPLTSEDRVQNERKRKRPSTSSIPPMPQPDTPYHGQPMQQSMPMPMPPAVPMMVPLDDPRQTIESGHPYSLATLSMAAEQAAMQDSSYMQHPQVRMPAVTGNYRMPQDELPPRSDAMAAHYPALDFDESLESLANFMDNGALSTHYFGSMISAEQPMPYFSSFEPLPYTNEMPSAAGHALSMFNQPQTHLEEPASFSRFASRLPSLQPEDKPAHSLRRPLRARGISDISLQDREMILQQLSMFSHILPQNFQLPSRLALSRYVAAYVNGFHEHLPFLHIPSMSVDRCSVELILAMAAVGAQYCFEGDRGVELFNAAHSIAAYRIRRRDARLAVFGHEEISEVGDARQDSRQHSSVDPEHSSNATPTSHQPKIGPLGLLSDDELDGSFREKDDLVQTAQALLVLMAMATWAKHKEILREALAIQSVLATLVRDDGLRSPELPDDVTWEQWIRHETTKRTKFIVYCFFNLHCIVYNIPPLILNAELHLNLPASAAEFRADTVQKWSEARSRHAHDPPLGFQDALSRLFSQSGRDVTGTSSSLGNYILIHAVIQHIFLMRQSARYRPTPAPELPADDVSALETALRNWQLGWSRNPESSLDPMDPNGPVAFNSTALLRLAYIRLNVDTGPGRALDTRDPVQIASAFRDAPALRRTPRLVRAVLHAAHALSIPVKIGVRLVAVTQTFIWSIQHSLCSLECAFLLSKWLDALAVGAPDPPVSDEERRIGRIVRTMLDETEFGVPEHVSPDSPECAKRLSAGVLRVWATIFRGAQTWAIVDVIGASLGVYADMLESG